MKTDKNKLQISKSVLKESCYTGYFTFLISNVRHSGFLQSVNIKRGEINFNQLTKRILIIHTNLMNIASLVYRINDEYASMNNNNIPYNLWRYYASLDIEALFRKYRSVFDNLAQLLKSYLEENSLPKSNSFNDLYKKIERNNKISINFKELIKSIGWFEVIKEIRDKIEHHGAEINVNKNKNGELVFICSELGRSLTNLPEKNILDKLNLEMQDGFVNFNEFVGVYIGYLIWLLEEISNSICSKLSITELDEQCKLCNPGFSLIQINIENLMEFT